MPGDSWGFVLFVTEDVLFVTFFQNVTKGPSPFVTLAAEMGLQEYCCYTEMQEKAKERLTKNERLVYTIGLAGLVMGGLGTYIFMRGRLMAKGCYTSKVWKPSGYVPGKSQAAGKHLEELRQRELSSGSKSPLIQRYCRISSRSAQRLKRCLRIAELENSLGEKENLISQLRNDLTSCT